MLHAVIMAGGAGTRFWPESRSGRPKQLLNLLDNTSMLQATVSRLAGCIPAERTLVVTSAKLLTLVESQLPMLPTRSILGEPCKRDTAACIGWAALHCLRSDPAATMLVMPSDHVIQQTATFQKSLELAAALVDAAPGRIVTFGIPPTYPAESFGYIEQGDPLPLPAEWTGLTHAAHVVKFREKPNRATAQEFLSSGKFLWNSGIFAWKAQTILDALTLHQPRMMEHLRKIELAWGTPQHAQVLAEEFSAIQGVSIDFAVMEHAQDVVVLAAPFDWDDVGSWQAIARLRGQDEQGNTLDAKHLGLATRGTIVRGPANHLIVTLGLQDVLIVHTPDATLVANKHDEESIRQLVKLLEEKGWTEYL